MIKIAIVDDDNASAALLQGYLKRYTDESGEAFDVTRYVDGDEITADYKPIFSVIFLDIKMKRLGGMETAEFIRSLDKDVILIFVTNLAQYAIKGYAVDAYDFLLKPVPYFAFCQQIKKLVERIKKRKATFVLLPVDNGVLKLDVSQIMFIESFKHKMLVHTADGKKLYSLPTTMAELSQKLEKQNFYRCGKSYLVNLSYVNAIKGNEVIVGDYTLGIGRGRKKEFLEVLALYVGGITL